MAGHQQHLLVGLPSERASLAIQLRRGEAYPAKNHCDRRSARVTTAVPGMSTKTTGRSELIADASWIKPQVWAPPAPAVQQYRRDPFPALEEFNPLTQRDLLRVANRSSRIIRFTSMLVGEAADLRPARGCCFSINRGPIRSLCCRFREALINAKMRSFAVQADVFLVKAGSSQRRVGADGLVRRTQMSCGGGSRLASANSEKTWAPFLAMPR